MNSAKMRVMRRSQLMAFLSVW